MNPESLAAGQSTNKPRDRQRILKYIESQGAAICDQVEVALGMPHQTASARIKDLRTAGILERTGETRATRTGSQAAVYRLREVAVAMEQQDLFGGVRCETQYPD